MGLFTTTEDPALEEARKRIVAAEVVCPACKAPFTKSGATLAASNPAIGLEGHRCPACGHVLTLRLPSPDGL
jgi:hypothetical protein